MKKTALYIAIFMAAAQMLKEGKCVIHCESDSYKKKESVLLSNGKYLRCKSERDPRVNRKKCVSEYQTFLEAGWYIRNDRIGMNITWQQRKGAFLMGQNGCNTEGFLLYTDIIDFTISVTIQKDKNGTEVVEEANETITFNFMHTNIYYKPGNSVWISIRSYPTGQRYSSNQDIVTHVKIPGCKDKECLKLEEIQSALLVSTQCVKQCKRKMRKLAKLTTTTPVQTTKKFHSFQTHKLSTTESSFATWNDNKNLHWEVILGTLTALFLVSIILLLLIRFKKKRKLRFKKKRKLNKNYGTEQCESMTILMVTDVERNQDLMAVSKLAAFIRDNFSYEIICNWEERNSISIGAVEWYRRCIDKSDMIIFTSLDKNLNFENITRNREESESKTEFQIAVNYFFANWEGFGKEWVFLCEKRNSMLKDQIKGTRKVYAFTTEYATDAKFYTVLENIRQRRHQKLDHPGGNTSHCNIETSEIHQNSHQQIPLTTLGIKHTAGDDNCATQSDGITYEETPLLIPTTEEASVQYMKQGARPKKQNNGC